MQERKKLLSFVIVGGGPTGVEVAAEVYDMVTDDMKRLYPNLMKDVKIRVVELMDHVLSTYDRKIGEYTGKLFSRNGIELVRPRGCAWMRVQRARSCDERKVMVIGPSARRSSTRACRQSRTAR